MEAQNVTIENNILNIVNHAIDLFELKKRDSGESFYNLKYDGKHTSVEPLKGALYSAHGDMIPDDYIYKAFLDALDFIKQAIEYRVDLTLDDIKEIEYEFTDAHVDIFYTNLSLWLSSNLNRAEYVNNYVSDILCGQFADGFDIFDVIRGGQSFELNHVYNCVCNYIEEQLGGK